jgi:hypothetical protein
MTRWLVTSAALGLLASAVSYAVLITTDTTAQFSIRLIAMLIWPTGLFLLANEAATSSMEVATNFAKAIGGNVLLYAGVGSLLYGLRTIVRRVASRSAT